MKLSDVRSEKRTITVAFDAGDLKVTYRPNAVTADAVDKVQEALRDPRQQTDGMFQMIGDMLVDWDLEGDDGKIVPLDDTARVRAEVPMGVFGRIFNAMQKDQNPGEAGARSSGG